VTTPDVTAAPAETKPVRRSTAKPERSPMAQRASAWVPDPKWAHPLEATAWLYFVALCTTRPGYEVPPALFALLAPIGIALAVWWSRRTWPDKEFGDDVPRSMAWLCGAASVASAAWLVSVGFLTLWRVVPVLLLLAVWFGAWYWVLRVSAPKKAQEIADSREAALLVRAEKTWQELLDATEPRLKVADVKPTRGGYVIGVEPKDPAKPVRFSELANKMDDLTTKAAARLAQEGVTVSAGTIRAEETEAAHVHLIHVCTKQILRESIEYVPFEGAPGTIIDPIDHALFEDGQELTSTYAGENGGQNGKTVGATGSGKSRSMNSRIGRIGENCDVLQGVVASSKLPPAVYPWIKPWLEGKAPKPALDFVAGQDPDQVLLMLAAIYLIVCDRNGRLSNEATHRVTPEEPAIVVWVEEAGDLANRTNTATLHDGRVVKFSQLIHLLTSQCRSAQVSIELLNQTDLYGALGEFGPEIARNTPYRICLKTLAPQDGTSVLPGLGAWGDTAKLKHNSMLVQTSIDEPRVMPAKAYNLGGDLIAPIATRNGGWRPELEPRLVEMLGDVWTDRWNAERLPELAAAAARDGLVWPEGRTEDAVDVELRKMLEQETGTAIPPPAPTVPETPMPTDSHGFPDADADAAELAAIAKRPAITLPEPLHAVMSLLREPGAPTDFVGTRQLVIMLGRISADADEKELNRVADELTREMRAIDDELRTTQRRGGGERARGYDVATLKDIAARIARDSQK
jgi:hypothetical protein